jgi:hypothetical protein
LQATRSSSLGSVAASLAIALAELRRLVLWKYLAGLYAALFVVHRFISSLFYSEFGVAPEEAGVGYAESLLEAAVGTFLLLVGVNAVVFALAIPPLFVSTLRTAGSLRRSWRRAKAHKGQALAFLAHRLAIVAAIVAGIWLSSVTGSWVWVVAAGLALGGLFELGGRVRNPFAAELELEPRAKGVGKPERDRTRLVVLLILALTALVAVSLLVTEAVRAPGAAEDAKRGDEVAGFPFTAWRAQHATVSWLGPTRPAFLADVQRHCLMYLGQANGIAVLYDVDSAATLRLPTGDFVLSVDDAQGGDGSPCP